jgi:hypothetical protein
MELTQITLSDNDLAWLEMAEQHFEAMKDDEDPSIPQSDFFSLVEDA